MPVCCGRPATVFASYASSGKEIAEIAEGGCATPSSAAAFTPVSVA